MADVTAHYSKTSELTLFLVSGRIAADDLIAAIETHYGNHPTSISIWDVSRADLSDLDMEALIRVSDCAKAHSQQRRNPHTIFVVRREQEIFLVKLYEEIAQMRGSPARYEHCPSLDDAYRALGLADPFAEQRDSA